ncbi:MAG: tRNA uridine-5-carboxymethylaminomethyl(34) synthesis GTPase MnmE [Burkholderiales bacterium]
MNVRDTIAAIATAPGRAAIGIVRISGPAVPVVLNGVVGRTLHPRHAVVSDFNDAQGRAIDHGIAIYFPEPNSYTGEHMLELHGHGGPVVLRVLLQRCLELGARLAEPGEFTQRAFLNGKMDLAQAESVIDVIDAATACAARAAMRSVKGEFSARIRTLTHRIVELRALIEATLDFPEEEVDALGLTDVRERLGAVLEAIDAVLETARQGSILRDGLHVVLAGQPNVGKSSLLNRLAGDDIAIVTDVPGTTRDAIKELIDVGGIPLHIIDTAGLRASADPVELVGIERTWAAIERADAVLQVIDSAVGLAPPDAEVARRLPAHLPRIQVMNKIDLVEEPPHKEESDGATVVWVSARTGAGIDLLREALTRLAGWHSDAETIFSARERHVAALRRAREHVDRAGREAGGLELVAEELRFAQQHLSSITGEFTADDLLGEIFSRFCIGK